MSTIEGLLQNAEAYENAFDKAELPLRPRSGSRSSPAWTRGSTRTGCLG